MKEIRLIIFDTDDLIEALEIRLRSHNEIDQYQRIVDPVLKGKGRDFRVEAGIYDTRTRKTDKTALSLHDLKETLILFCKKRGIPLSLRAVKNVQLYEGQVTLTMGVSKARS